MVPVICAERIALARVRSLAKYRNPHIGIRTIPCASVLRFWCPHPNSSAMANCSARSEYSRNMITTFNLH